jgi:hypothetical protein
MHWKQCHKKQCVKEFDKLLSADASPFQTWDLTIAYKVLFGNCQNVKFHSSPEANEMKGMLGIMIVYNSKNYSLALATLYVIIASLSHNEIRAQNLCVIYAKIHIIDFIRNICSLYGVKDERGVCSGIQELFPFDEDKTVKNIPELASHAIYLLCKNNPTGEMVMSMENSNICGLLWATLSLTAHNYGLQQRYCNYPVQLLIRALVAIIDSCINSGRNTLVQELAEKGFNDQFAALFAKTLGTDSKAEKHEILDELCILMLNIDDSDDNLESDDGK